MKNSRGDVLFISDLHLSLERPDLIRIFLHFLKSRARSAYALYILGDFFKVWLGNDLMQPWHYKIMEALKQYSKDHHLYFIRGNRDFLIDQHFFYESGCFILPDEYVVPLDHFKVLIIHGDCLCTKDKSYQMYRRFVRQKWVIKMILGLPKSVRCKMTNFLKRPPLEAGSPYDIEKKRTVLRRKKKIDDSIDLERVAVMMQAHEADCMIHGHIHKAEHHVQRIECPLNAPRSVQRWVLGDWDQYWWVLCYKNGNFKQERYTVDECIK